MCKSVVYQENREECPSGEHNQNEILANMCPMAQLARACDCYIGITRSRVQASLGQIVFLQRADVSQDLSTDEKHRRFY